VRSQAPAPTSAPATSKWDAAIGEGWDVAGNANGGYLLTIAARALGTALGRPDPVTVTAHFLAPGRPGDVTVEAHVVKQGRRFGTGTATMWTGSRPLLTCVGSFGDLSGAHDDAPELVDRTPPELPPAEACTELVPTDTFPPPFVGQVELRLHPDDSGFGSGRGSGRARMRGWFRLRDGEVCDTLALLCAVDAFPPTVFNANLPIAWAPTLELTAHVRARPAPGWLRCEFSSHFITGGFLEADGEVWDSRGHLVAQSRQLALVPRA
jgi:acyl-CoA thioesterase